MTEQETIDRLIGLLHAGDPFVHVRFGDGDVFFATATGPTLTADGEEWTPELGGRLRYSWQALAMLEQPLLVGDVESYAVSDGCEQQWQRLLEEATRLRGRPPELVHIEALRAGYGFALDFYRAVETDARAKVLVGPEHLGPAAAMLDAEHIEIPLRVAHEFADELAAAVIDSKAEVVLFAAGRGGKIMQAIIGRTAPGIVQVDVGSGLDILFGGVRRGTDAGVDDVALRREYQAAGLLVA